MSVVLQVSVAAGSKWLEIGVFLGFKTEELDGYEEREPKCLHHRLFWLLADWKKREVHATVGALLLACQKAGVGGEVKRELGLIT